MAYTTPATSVAGTALTAAFLNTYVRDNMSWVATDSPCCRVRRTTAQSITQNTDTLLLFDAEDYDNAALHSTSSNTGQITIPTGGAGKYLFGASGQFASVPSFPIASLQLNSTASFTNEIVEQGIAAWVILVPYAVAAADYVVNVVYYNSAGPINVQANPNTGGHYTPYFYALWFRT